MFIYLFPCLLLYEVFATINVANKGILPLEKNSVGLKIFIDVNDMRASKCGIESWPKRCCLSDSDSEDCGIVHLYGAKTYIANPEDTDTILLYVYPTLVAHDLVGYCDFVLQHTCGPGNRKSRQIVNIPFDTRVYKSDKPYIKDYVAHRNVARCSSLDEDSLYYCAPVDCDLKYLGAKPFYDKETRKCERATLCRGNPHKRMPDLVYLPSCNGCRDLEKPLTDESIYELSTGLHTIIMEPIAPTMFKVDVKSNCSTLSQNIQFLKDLLFGRLSPVKAVELSDYKSCCRTAMYKILFMIIGISVVVLCFICCIQTVEYILDGTFEKAWRSFVKSFRKKFEHTRIVNSFLGPVNTDVRNTLLRDVIQRDIPIHLRDSVVDICERMDKEVRWKKRYRAGDMGSQLSLQEDADMSLCSTSTVSSESHNNEDR